MLSCLTRAAHVEVCLTLDFLTLIIIITIIELHDNTGMNALKQALLLQRELASLKEELSESVKPDEPKYSVGTSDHSFQHYVDYKDIGTFESH